MNKLWDSYPAEVQVLLNLAQTFVSAKAHLRETLGQDLVALRRNHNRDINAIVDNVAKAETDLIEAVRAYEKAGGNWMEAGKKE